MKIYGLDFTSAPTRKNPIVCAECRLDRGVLTVERFIKFSEFQGFEQSLRSAGPWVAGMDFPFGQPRKLVQNLGWPKDWEGYVRHVGDMGKASFEATIREYIEDRPLGDKHHKRVVDRLANAQSPMKLNFVPVGKMFFQGAPRLAAAEVSVLPCRPMPTDRIVVEAYPALVARKAVGAMSYKTGARSSATAAKVRARHLITDWICSPSPRPIYGCSLRLGGPQIEACVRDASGDTLDAVLCAVQAAWAWTRRNRDFGIPEDCDASEGWIVDPILFNCRPTVS